MMTVNSPKVLIILPVIDELSNIQVLLPELLILPADVSILFIDDSSSDGSFEFLSEQSDRLSNVFWIHRSSRLGIGSAHSEGFRFALYHNFDFVITMDADMTHNPADVPRVIDKLFIYDVVFTDRYENTKGLRHWTFSRRVLTLGGHLATKIFFRSKIDMSSGFRGYRKESIRLLIDANSLPSNYDFFFFTALKIIDSNLKYVSIPIEVGFRGHGQSKMTIRLACIGVMKLIKVAVHRIICKNSI